MPIGVFDTGFPRGIERRRLLLALRIDVDAERKQRRDIERHSLKLLLHVDVLVLHRRQTVAHDSYALLNDRRLHVLHRIATERSREHRSLRVPLFAVLNHQQSAVAEKDSHRYAFVQRAIVLLPGRR